MRTLRFALLISLAALSATPSAAADPPEVYPPGLWEVVPLVPTTCAKADDATVCVYTLDAGTYRSVGVAAAGPDGTWTAVHFDESDTFFGVSRWVMAEGGFDGTWIYWNSAFSDYGPDGTIDDVCVVCGGVVDEEGYLVSQRLAADGTGANAVLAVRHEGMLRGANAGVYGNEPYAHVFL